MAHINRQYGFAIIMIIKNLCTITIGNIHANIQKYQAYNV